MHEHSVQRTLIAQLPECLLDSILWNYTISSSMVTITHWEEMMEREKLVIRMASVCKAWLSRAKKVWMRMNRTRLAMCHVGIYAYPSNMQKIHFKRFMKHLPPVPRRLYHDWVVRRLHLTDDEALSIPWLLSTYRRYVTKYIHADDLAWCCVRIFGPYGGLSALRARMRADKKD